jgi:hypothetical protein
MISGGYLGTDFVGGSAGWSDANVTTRRAIAAAHAQYVAGVVWFLGNDAAVPPALRADMAEYGLCGDEFADTDPPHFPHQLYVRESRRRVGDFVLTQNAPSAALRARSIGLGSYVYDAHNVQRGVRLNNSTGAPEAFNEGEIAHQSGVTQPPYVLPYDTLLPARAQSSPLSRRPPSFSSRRALRSWSWAWRRFLTSTARGCSWRSQIRCLVSVYPFSCFFFLSTRDFLYLLRGGVGPLGPPLL